MLHHIATISVCYGGHFESKMTAKIQKSSDVGGIWYYYRHDRVKNWALIISYYVLTLFFIHTTSTCIVRLGDICSALRYSNQYLFLIKSRCVVIYNSKVYTRTYCRWNTISVTKHDLSVEITEMHSFG
jgi:hypothetical protein